MSLFIVEMRTMMFFVCLSLGEAFTPPSLVSTWISAAIGVVRTLPLDDPPFHDHVSLSSVTIYTAEAPFGSRLVASLPDGSISRYGSHEAVLILDPTPKASFGHVLFVFFVDRQMTPEKCTASKGIRLANDDCLIHVLKNRCHNLTERKLKRKQMMRRCEIHFLPMVTVDDGKSGEEGKQILQCRDDIPGFSPCPHLRPLNSTRNIVCNPLHVNTQSCSTTHETVHTRCRLFEICDHAVLLAGGWNRDHSDVSTAATMRSVYRMLRSSGFPRQNIKTFYANGATGAELFGENYHSLYPATMKLAMRYHIQKLCGTAHCVDSLVFYLNNPSKIDGNMLLWDLNNNGEADETESYSVKELLADLRDCTARRVFLIVDQSFSGEIVKAFSRSKRHGNVAVFASGQDDQIVWEEEYTKLWVRANHKHACVTDIHQSSLRLMKHSTPTMFDGSNGTIRTTLAGAPCETTSLPDQSEIETNYFGCQHLPTKLWISNFIPGNINSHLSWENS